MHPIESKTLRLEPLTVDHAEEMFESLSSTALYDYMPGAPSLSVAALRERYAKLARGTSADGQQLWLNWIIRLASGPCVGFVQATIYPRRTGDFAFVVAPEYWGRGVAFEACQAAIPYIADELRVTELFATVDPKNTRSIRLLTRLGFNEVAPALYPHGEVEPNDRVFSFSC
jgi:[ribosomal protein S5]-alanine N-acetyltransferase